METASLGAAVLSPRLRGGTEDHSLISFCPRAHGGLPGGQGDSGFWVRFLEQQIKVLESERNFLHEAIESPTLKPLVRA